MAPSRIRLPAGTPIIARSAVEVLEEIGRGRFKRVHRGRWKGREVALVAFPEGRIDEKELQLMLRLTKSCPSCAPVVYGITTLGEDMRTTVVQELASVGSVKQLLRGEQQHRRSGAAMVAGFRFTTAHRLQAARLLLAALTCLEAEHIVHGDIACRNVLCFAVSEAPENTVVKLSDFGLSLALDGTSSEVQATVSQTDSFVNIPQRAVSDHCRQPRAIRWSAPETIGEDKLSHGTDVWSFGATLWELFSGGQAPWAGWQTSQGVRDQLLALFEGTTAAAAAATANSATPQASGAARVGATGAITAAFWRPARCPRIVHDVILRCLTVNEFARPTLAYLGSALAEALPDAEHECAAIGPTTTANEDAEWVLL